MIVKNKILDNLMTISFIVGLIGLILFYFNINRDLGLYILIISGAIIVFDLFRQSQKKQASPV